MYTPVCTAAVFMYGITRLILAILPVADDLLNSQQLDIILIYEYLEPTEVNIVFIA